ncbi:MAG: flagellar export protein FliJ [Treponema sp.]|nr:flagellar export protein FliJ [Treponema sp.]MBR4385783.1 flagellar export protein FliJ [Treponema sp.]
MKKFNYSMQKILDLRNFELDQAEVDLGKTNAEIAVQNNTLKAIAEQKVSVSRSTDASSDLNDYYAADAYFKLLEQRKEMCFEELARLEPIAEQKRGVVRECMKKVKVLEQLKKSKMGQWKKQNLKEEELAMDEVVTFKSSSASDD